MGSFCACCRPLHPPRTTHQTALPLQVHVEHEGAWARRDVLGVHPQKQAGFYWVGACVPAGRMQAHDFHALAAAAERCACALYWWCVRVRVWQLWVPCSFGDSLALPSARRPPTPHRLPSPTHAREQVWRRHRAPHSGGECGAAQRARGASRGAAGRAHL